MRVHQLAKELEIPSKELIEQMAGIGIKVANHMSALEEDQIKKIQDAFGKPKPVSEEPAPAPAESEDAAPEGEEAEAPEPEEPKGPKTIKAKGPMVVKELADELGLRPNQLIAQLMGMNIFASINEKIDVKTVKQLAQKNGFIFEQEKKKAEKKPPPPKPKKLKDKKDQQPEKLENRPPVVTFMGHVDHGKTSLLDHIRKSKVTDGESGGITQHIGAYSVETSSGTITFLDTPGHAAFTSMRARGANLTDIAVLVVAADDGIMPQTKEAIQHAKAAGVAIIVAINKMDLPGANPDRVKQQLQQNELSPEDWGGETICVPVSATKGDGMDDLLEMISLQAEVLELKANTSGPAEGYVIEAQLESGRGPTATVLVRSGQLKAGDTMICGTSYGKVKAMYDDSGNTVKKVSPSGAAKVLGLSEVPEAGAAFITTKNEREARREVETLIEEKRKEKLTTPDRPATLESLFAAKDNEEKAELPLIIKTDVQGTLEAIIHSIEEINSDKVKPVFVLAGVGNITANDVLLAKASNALIVGFHVAKESGSGAAAKKENVDIRLYAIIYELIDEIRGLMTGLLKPSLEEKFLGQAEVKQIFNLTKKGPVAGCIVLTGLVTAKSRARIIRGKEAVYEGVVSSLRRFQNEAAEVRQGQECGIRLDNFNDYLEGDIIELYEVQEVAQKL